MGKKKDEKLKLITEKFELIQLDYKELFKKNEVLTNKLKELQTTYSNLFTSTLRYRTFYRRLKNLFSKF
jgi:FtsZ-binding cell division protein ZapB